MFPDQNIRSVGTELGPNYLQMLSADKERVGKYTNNIKETKSATMNIFRIFSFPF